MEKKVKISVAMTTFNGELYVREQIDSIIAQTILPQEIIIVDDCSTDNTLSILHNYRERYPSLIKVYQNESNNGPLYSFRKAFELCKGEWIAPSDQDDIWFADKLEKCHEACVSMNVKMIFHQDRIWYANGDMKDSQHPTYTLNEILYSPRCTGHTAFFHRTALDVFSWVNFICYDWALVLWGLGSETYRQIDYVGCLWRRHSKALTSTIGGEETYIKKKRGKWETLFVAMHKLINGEHNKVIEKDAHDQEIILSHFIDSNATIKPYVELTKCFQKQTFFSFIKAGYLSIYLSIRK